MRQSLIDLEIVKRSSAHLAALQSAGYEVSAPSDYGQITSAVAATGRAQQSPMFSIARNDFTRGDAFWLFLEHDGAPVAGCAAKMIDLNGEGIDTYLRRTSQEQYARTSDPIATVAKPLIAKLYSQLIYIGELEIHPAHRGRLKTVFSFMRLLQALAVLKWPRFEAIYAFVPAQHVKLADGYGFNWRLPRAITWHDPVPKGRLNDHWAVAIDRVDFAHIWATP